MLPWPCTGIDALAMSPRSTRCTVTSLSCVTGYLELRGMGLGLTMQTLVLATQNAVPISDLGAATAAVSFFRSLGGSIGVALFGALLNSRLAERLDGLTVSVGEGSSFSPDSLRGLPAASAGLVRQAFSESLTGVFLLAAPLLVVGVVLTLTMRETTLRTSTARPDDLGRELGVTGAGGSGEPTVPTIVH